MPDFSNANLFEWLVNNGVAVAVLFIFMFTIGRQITHAVNYFTQKLDIITTTNNDAVRELTGAINGLSTTAAQNNEALKIVMLFISHNMQEMVAHRVAVEGTGPQSDAPSTGVISPLEGTKPNGGRRPKTDNPQN